MKKFISAVTSLCMAATMTSVVVPASINAADASKGFILKTYDQADSKYATAGSNVTVSAADVAAGDVVIPCGFYLDEATNDCRAITGAISVLKGPDASKVKLKSYNPLTQSYFKSDKTFNTKMGDIETNYAVSFAASFDDFGEYSAHGDWQVMASANQSSVGFDNYYVGLSWTNGGYAYEWTGNKSTDFPMYVFDVTIPQGAAEGEYEIGFATYNTDTTGKHNNPSNLIETTERFSEELGNLKTTPLKITVGAGGTSSTTTTGESTTTSTTTTTTTTGGGSVSSNKDIVIDFGGSVVGEKGKTVTVEPTISNGNGKTHAIAGIHANFSLDAPLTLAAVAAKSDAFGGSKVSANKEALIAEITPIDPDSGDPTDFTNGGKLFKINISIPADCPDGDYTFTLKDDSEFVYITTTNEKWSFEVKPLTIKVGNGGTISTTSSSVTTSTTTKTPSGNANISVDFGGKVKGEKGKTVTIEPTISSADGKSHPIAGIHANFSLDAPLTLAAVAAKSDAFGGSKVSANKEALIAEITPIDPDSGDPTEYTEGGKLFKINISIPADCPDGEYTFTLKDDSEFVYITTTNEKWTFSVTPATIVVGDTTDTTTSSSTTTTTTTTTSSTTSSTTTTSTPVGTPVYGDANCDGVVNVADVVVLNKWLNNNADYNLTEQGKLNADCYAPKNGTEITPADSDAIIKSIVSLVTLPVNA